MLTEWLRGRHRILKINLKLVSSWARTDDRSKLQISKERISNLEMTVSIITLIQNLLTTFHVLKRCSKDMMWEWIEVRLIDSQR
jgi:hypothetical protein